MITGQSSLIFVLYDGINNSVFESQILQPLYKEIKKKKWNKIILVSFEKQSITKNALLQKIPQQEIEIIILKKISFIGKISLLSAAHQFKKIIKTIDHATIIARGPFAGWICLKSIKSTMTLTIQARGLLAAEYVYTHRNTKIIKKLLHKIRTWQFTKIEKCVYYNNNKPHVTIEAVSPALKTYLIKEYNASDKKITIARNDIPQLIPLHERTQCRTTIRQQLHIAPDTHVYCYNGSLKPWQCPEKIISFFQDRLQKNNTLFLLVLTQDTKQFEKLINNKIHHSQFLVLNVPHQQIYRYLSACDTGIIFREPHILNWIARPTKILEYQAARLKIIHNNTIAWLSEKSN